MFPLGQRRLSFWALTLSVRSAFGGGVASEDWLELEQDFPFAPFKIQIHTSGTLLPNVETHLTPAPPSVRHSNRGKPRTRFFHPWVQHVCFGLGVLHRRRRRGIVYGRRKHVSNHRPFGVVRRRKTTAGSIAPPPTATKQFWGRWGRWGQQQIASWKTQRQGKKAPRHLQHPGTNPPTLVDELTEGVLIDCFFVDTQVPRHTDACG